MIIPIIMHIDLAVILGIVIFPLAFLIFLLGSIWLKIKENRQFLAILGQNSPRRAASGKLFLFSHLSEVCEACSF